MRVALLSTFAASRNEPLVAMMSRVHQALVDAALGEPSIRFNFGDAMVPGFTSGVDRALERHPELKRFLTDAEPVPGILGVRRISNGPLLQGAGEAVPYETLQAIATGVPRSFPFHSVVFHFFVTVELALDVGTWSHLVLAMFRVLGAGFKASLMLPVAPRALAFVPDIERAAGPSPEWYRPES